MNIIRLVVTVIVLLYFTVAQAGDIGAGSKKSEVCAACHGAVGISPNGVWPNLAGQQQEYLVKQLKDFREGRRSDPWMSPMSKTLSNDDIDDLASFFNSLPIHDKYQ